MKGITLIIAGSGSTTSIAALVDRFQREGYEDVQIISAGEAMERGITIDKNYPTEPIPFEIEPMPKLKEYFDHNPRKGNGKKKGYTEQPWRKHFKK